MQIPWFMRDEQLILTKTIPPQIRDKDSRKDLQGLLQQALYYKLTLVISPPGYGKTTALAAWRSASRMRCGWLSLDEGDDDFDTLYAYLALTVSEAFSITVAPLDYGKSQVRKRLLKRIFQESAMKGFVNSLADVSGQGCMIIDNCECLKGEDVLNALSFLITYLPPQIHLVLAGRSFPDIPLESLKLRQELLELQVPRLRLSASEIKDYLCSRDIRLAEVEYEMLRKQTEGWPYALQVWAGKYSGRTRQEGDVELRWFYRYFREMLFDKLSSDLQETLMAIAVPEMVCNELYERLVRPSMVRIIKKGETLEQLATSQLFLFAHETQQSWFRFHRLFREFLVMELEISNPGQLQRLTETCVLWKLEQGYIISAIEQAVDGELYELAAQALSDYHMALCAQGHIDVLFWGIKQLPQEHLKSYPSLVMLRGFGALIQGQRVDEVQRMLQQGSLAGVGNAGMDFIQDFFSTFHQHGFDNSGLLLAQLHAQLPDELGFLKTSLASMIPRIIHLSQGYVPSQIQYLHSLLGEVGVDREDALSKGLLCQLGFLHLCQGNLEAAHTTFQSALEGVTREEGDLPPSAGEALIGLGAVSLEAYKLQEAQALIARGMEMVKHLSMPTYMQGGLFYVQALIAYGDFEKARILLAELQDAASRFDLTNLDDRYVQVYRYNLYRREGHLELARNWADTILLSGCDTSQVFFNEVYSIRELELLEAARIWIDMGEYQSASELLRVIRSHADERGRLYRMMQCDVEQAIITYRQGDIASAAVMLDSILAAAQEKSLVRCIIDAQQRVKPILVQASQTGSQFSYARELLQTLDPLACEQAYEEGIQSVLSRREMEVLKEAASGLANKEIADTLGISERTVKWHLGHVYEKLGTTSRHQAAERARRLGLLEGSR